MRIQSIDSFRVFAILAVVSLHTQPFSTTHFFGEIDVFLSAMFNQGARFAVPFFFIASGYFLGKKLERNKEQSNRVIISSIVRLLEIWFFWNLVYIFSTISSDSLNSVGIIKTMYWRISTYIFDSTLEHLILEGARTSLWFLISLILSISIVGLFHNTKTKNWLVGLSIFLYIVGLLGGSYSQTDLGLDLSLNTRNGPFFGTLFVVTGYLLATTIHLKYISLPDYP